MKITLTFLGRETTVELDRPEAVLGRRNPYLPPDIDLSADLTVSRTHARIWEEQGNIWVEDLASKFGTYVNGVKIEYQRQLNPGDVIRLGETDVAVWIAPRATPVEVEPSTRSGLGIQAALNAEEAPLSLIAASLVVEPDRVVQLMELPLALAAQRTLDGLASCFVERVGRMFRDSSHAALMLFDPATTQLKVRSYLPPSPPTFSESIARRSLIEARAFIWRPQPGTAGQDIGPFGGLCAPLLWERQPVGVIVVDNPHGRPGAEEKSLRVLLAAAHYGAAALAQRQDAEVLRANVDAMERLLTRTPPDVRARVVKP